MSKAVARRLTVAAALAAVSTLPLSTAQVGAAAAAPKKFANCKALNATYAHGVGKKGAKDKTSGTPVTDFARKPKVYKVNKKKLDRDKDGIACEKA